jgi:serine/threonine-protein kinase RsbT
VLARDDGPGIDDIRQAMQDGYSTSGGLGLGLGGARRLMDEFDIDSKPGEGTTVTAVKWCRPDRW